MSPTHLSDQCRSISRLQDERATVKLLQGLAAAHPINPLPPSMIPIQTYTYTSLKDILPKSPHSVLSPTDSWNEIHIKNPLVKLKQVAMAYLQRTATPPETGEKGWCGKSRWSGCLGFVSWLRQVIFRTCKRVVMVDHGGDYGDEDCYEDDDDDHEKVY